MSIPSEAKFVFKGVIFDVYQWQQKMFDGTYQTFEALKRPDTVQIIATQGDKIVMAEQEQPDRPHFCSLFGGRIEPGEEPLAAAKRELLEESGLKSNDWELFKTYEMHGKIIWNLHYFLARQCHQAAEQKLDVGEKITIRTVTWDEFVDLMVMNVTHDTEFTGDILRLKLNPPKLEEFKKRLFKNI